MPVDATRSELRRKSDPGSLGGFGWISGNGVILATRGRMHRMHRSAATRRMCHMAVAVALIIAPRASDGQQARAAGDDLGVVSDARLRPRADSVRPNAQKTFFVKPDLVASGIAFAASVGVSAFDLRIAHWARSPGVQGDSSRHDR